MRNIHDVINAMLQLIPDAENEFRAQLTAIMSSAMFAAPETMALQWQRMSEVATMHIPRPATEEWHFEVIAALMNIPTDIAREQFGADGVEPPMLGPAKRWDDFENIVKVVRAAYDGQWAWYYNTRCKYVEVRIDMRDGHCMIRDREGKVISLSGLLMQAHGRHTLSWEDELAQLVRQAQQLVIDKGAETLALPTYFTFDHCAKLIDLLDKVDVSAAVVHQTKIEKTGSTVSPSLYVFAKTEVAHEPA